MTRRFTLEQAGEAYALANAVNIGIGIDGSKLSDMAQAFAAALVKRRGVKGDKLTAMHIVPVYV